MRFPKPARRRLPVVVAAVALLVPSRALADRLYSVYSNQGETVRSYIVGKTKVAENLYRVRTKDIGSRSVFPGGVQAGTQTVRCSAKDPHVVSETGRTEIQLKTDKNYTPTHAEQVEYNLWWAVCRDVYRKY